jgi:hypothetical protein
MAKQQINEAAPPSNFDPRAFDANALAHVGDRATRVRITACVIKALLEDGITVSRGRHKRDSFAFHAELWPRVRSMVCSPDGRNLEQVLRDWPAASGGLWLGELIKVLLAAVARREQLRAELAALEVLGEIEQHHAPDPKIKLQERLLKQFPPELYDPTRAAQ